MYNTASGVPIPQGTDAFSPATQFKGWADAEAVYDNFFNVNLDSDRTSLASPQLRDGVFCWVRGTQILWSYQGATWVKTLAPIETAVLTPASGITIVAQSLTKQNGMVTLNLRVTGTIFSGTQLTTIPVGFRPIAAFLPPAVAIIGSTPSAAASQTMTTGEVFGYTSSNGAYSFGISCSYLAA